MEEANYGLGHHNDIVNWGLEMDKSGPFVSRPRTSATTVGCMIVLDYVVESEYAGGYKVTISNKHKMGPEKRKGYRVDWEDGWVYVDRGRLLHQTEMDCREDRPWPKEGHKSNSHHRNFIECIRSVSNVSAPLKLVTVPPHPVISPTFQTNLAALSNGTLKKRLCRGQGSRQATKDTLLR